MFFAPSKCLFKWINWIISKTVHAISKIIFILGSWKFLACLECLSRNGLSFGHSDWDIISVETLGGFHNADTLTCLGTLRRQPPMVAPPRTQDKNHGLTSWLPSHSMMGWELLKNKGGSISFQNPFLLCPSSLWLGIRTQSVLGTCLINFHFRFLLHRINYCIVVFEYFFTNYCWLNMTKTAWNCKTWWTSEPESQHDPD